MKWLAFSLCGILMLGAPAGVAAEVAGGETVYLMPMGGGLDQFLANQLTSHGVLRVVTDPRKADTVFTDRLGKELEVFLEESQPAQKTGAAEEGGTGDEDAAKDEKAARQSSTFGRGKGNVFLVDRKTGAVLWSTYERPKNTTPDQLNKAAMRIVERLKRK